MLARKKIISRVFMSAFFSLPLLKFLCVLSVTFNSSLVFSFGRKKVVLTFSVHFFYAFLICMFRGVNGEGGDIVVGKRTIRKS